MSWVRRCAPLPALGDHLVLLTPSQVPPPQLQRPGSTLPPTHPPPPALPQGSTKAAQLLLQARNATFHPGSQTPCGLLSRFSKPPVPSPGLTFPPAHVPQEGHSFPAPTMASGQGHPSSARHGVDWECGTLAQTTASASQGLRPYCALKALVPYHPLWGTEAWNAGGREAWSPPTCHTHDASCCPRPEGHRPYTC